MTTRRTRRLLQAGMTLLLLAGLAYVRARSNAGPTAGTDAHRSPATESPRSPDLDSSRSPATESPRSPDASTSRSAGPSVLDAFRSHRSNVELVTGGR